MIIWCSMPADDFAKMKTETYPVAQDVNWEKFITSHNNTTPYGWMEIQLEDGYVIFWTEVDEE